MSDPAVSVVPSNIELDRRITSLEARVDAIDMHGTRGMEVVRATLGAMGRDLGKVESAVDRVETGLATVNLQLAAQKGQHDTWARLLAIMAVLAALASGVAAWVAVARH